MSFYQEYETPPPLNIDDDDDSSKLEDGDFNDEIEQYSESIDIPEIPQHSFFSSSPPPDNNIPENDTGDYPTTPSPPPSRTAYIESNKNEETETQYQMKVSKELIDKDDAVAVEAEAEEITNCENVTQVCAATESEPAVEENSDDEFQFESFKEAGPAPPVMESNELSDDHFESFKANGFSAESDDFVFERFRLPEEAAAVAAPEILRTIAHQSPPPSQESRQEEEIHFEADFSNFEASFPSAEEEKACTDSQINHSVQVSCQEEHVAAHVILEDDDDFGDFNDFTQAPVKMEMSTLTSPYEPSMPIVKPDIVKIMDQSFPYEKTEESRDAHEGEMKQNETRVFNLHLDNLMKYLKDIDVTLALTYDYKDSCTHSTLVKALGIDRRNILFGPKWNSSSSSTTSTVSNVPRFASDLSFNPLQPQKSASTAATQQNEKPPAGKDTDSFKPQQPDVIPDVEFDWNGAGLKNPLDAKQSKIAEELLSVMPGADNFEGSLHKSEKSNPNEDEAIQHVWSEEPFDISSNHVIVRERVIKLPETHIFTPIKSVSPIAISNDSSVDESGNCKIEKASIYVKEYHDVEYSLEPKYPIKSDASETDFDDFQSATTINDDAVAAASTDKIDAFMPHGSESRSQPQALSLTPLDILKPTEVSQACVSKPQKNSDMLVPQKVNYSSSINQREHRSTAPSLVDDFDFTEFQAAPCVNHQAIAPTTVAASGNTTSPPKEKSDSLTLSPMHLVNSYKANSENKSKYLGNAMSIDNSNCDDDWSDFVSSTATPANLPPRTSSSDSAWSDFVSVPMKPTSYITNSSQLSAKPNFSSWNQPVSSRPYAVNHSTSFLSSYHPSDTNEQNMMPPPMSTATMTTMMNKSMNITNNFNYSGDQSEKKAAYQQHGMMSNGISTILPDLQFAMPNNLINLSRANPAASSSSGKK